MLAPAPPRRRWLFPADGGALFERKVDSNTGGHGPHLFLKKEMSGSSARHPVSQGPSAQGVNVTPKIEEAGCLDDTLPVIIIVQNHGRALNAPVSSIFALRNQEFALFWPVAWSYKTVFASQTQMAFHR